MKKIKYFTIAAGLFSAFLSCKKSNTSSGLAALNIIQATANIPGVIVNLADTVIPFYQNRASIPYGAFMEFGMPSGNNPFMIFSTNDTVKPLLNGNFNLKSGAIYSFYLAGHDMQIDTLLMEDLIPAHSDSSAGVRFINLSADSQPISINLQGNPPEQAEFAGLGYKQITEFKTYTAANAITSYSFEVRDQATGNLFATFTWNLSLFKNNTLVIYGLVDPASASPINVFQVNNF